VTSRAAPVTALAALAGLVVAGCGSVAPNSKSAPPTLHGSDTVVSVGNSDYGAVLVDGKGATLYLFTADSSGDIACTGACAQTWKPYVAKGTPHAADQLRREIRDYSLGTVTRPDGTEQVTYKGRPLYYYSKDKKSGAANGEGKSQFGGKWYLVSADGGKVYP
jgi:predicted lipoprotein with Yx(FWY)xxD motif